MGIAKKHHHIIMTVFMVLIMAGVMSFTMQFLHMGGFNEGFFASWVRGYGTAILFALPAEVLIAFPLASRITNWITFNNEAETDLPEVAS